MDAWRTEQSCSASRHPALIFFTFSQIGNRLPNSWNSRPVVTDKLQIHSWHPGPARGSDPSLLASHLNGPWRVICVQEGSAFVSDSSLAENFHVVTQLHGAVLFNKDTFTRDFSCTPIKDPCSLRCSSWAVEGMVVTGRFRRAPDPSCAYFTVANVHINNECAKGCWFKADLVLASFPCPRGRPAVAERAPRSTARRRERWLRSVWRH